MTIKQQIEADLKSAMLAGEKSLVTTLRGLKAVILNEEVAKGAREAGLDEDSVLALLQREAKKRQESADLYKQGGNQDKYNAELAEKEVIQRYLPAQLDEAAITKLIDQAITELGKDQKNIGQIINKVKQQAGASAEGSVIARLTRERLAS